jgi:hypothetical protein
MATYDNDTTTTIGATSTSASASSSARGSGARARVQGAIGSARDRASAAGQQVGTRVDEAPLVALVGGVALGAAIGALLPRTEREARTLGAVGNKLGQAAADAARAAVDAGKHELGLSQAAKSPVEAIIDKALGAVSAAGTAAGSAAASKVAGGKSDATAQGGNDMAPPEGK